MAPLRALPMDRVSVLLDSSAQLTAVYEDGASNGMALATYATRDTTRFRVSSMRILSVEMPQLVMPPHLPSCCEDSIIGVAALVWTAHHETLTANILGVGVDPKHREEGVAGALMDALLMSAFEVAQFCRIRPTRWNAFTTPHTTPGHIGPPLLALYPCPTGPSQYRSVPWSTLTFVLHQHGSCRRKPAGLRVLLRSGFQVEQAGLLLTEADLRLPKYQAGAATVALSVLPRSFNLLQPWLNPRAPYRDGRHFIPAHMIIPEAQEGGNIAERRGGAMGHTVTL